MYIFYCFIDNQNNLIKACLHQKDEPVKYKMKKNRTNMIKKIKKI